MVFRLSAAGFPANTCVTMTHSDPNLERLLRHAADADRFAQWVEGGVEAPVPVVRTSQARWWIGGGMAAAAAVALGFVFLRPAPAPMPERVVIKPIAPAPAAVESLPMPREHTPVVTLAAQPADLSSWYHLAPDAEDGIPSLTDERSVLLAVYEGQDASCGCLAWRVADGERFKQAKSAVLAEAIAMPCGTTAREVTVYAVSGPRYLLPFHEEDAMELAQCLAATPGEECVSPDAALAQITDAPSDLSLPDLAASALAMCVPSGLTVTSMTMPLAGR